MTLTIERRPGRTPVDDGTRREFIVGGLTLAGLLAGCGDDGARDQDDGTYPRNVRHGLGTTRIGAPPKRIVTTYGEDLDALTALGRTPIAAAQAAGHRYFGWIHLPTTVKVVDKEPELNLEQLAGLRADLILGDAEDLKDLYAQCSRIAPTVAIDTTGDWRVQTRVIAAALAEEDRGAALIRGREAALAACTRKVRACAGDRTVSVVYAGGGYFAYGAQDIGGSFAVPYGLPYPKMLAKTGGELSSEQLRRLDADVILIGGDDADKLLAEPVFRQLPAARGGKALTLTQDEFGALAVTAPRVDFAIANTIPKVLQALGC